MNNEFTNMTDGYDDVAPEYGNVFEPLEKDHYPVRILEIKKTDTTNAGASRFSLMAEITEGPLKGRKALITSIYVSPALREVIKDGDNIERDSNGRATYRNRPSEDLAKATKGTQGRVKGLLDAFGLPHRNPTPTLRPNDEGYIYDFFGIQGLVGREAIVGVGVSGDFNTYDGAWPVDHNKYGLAAWRQKNLPRQMKKYAGNSAVVAL